MKRVLVPNRGEIALRIQRGCEAVGIECVIALSEADMNGMVARKAHRIESLGPAAPQESYLNIPRIIALAKAAGCDGVHPGYGFLAEDAEFAAAVVAAGLTFVGPRAESMRLLGSKAQARIIAAQCGIPTITGSAGGLSDDQLLETGNKLGFPVIIKAVAGGGGRGMRIARSLQELKDLLPRARGEALKFFASDQLFLERYLENIRHIEVQVFGDKFGKVVHFGTRDCSIQRRHQKLVEEAPAPFLSDSLREQIHNAAVKIVAHVAYENAGTVEFLVQNEEFFFTEVNTRIQVEHPVTEAVTGCDLVALQLKIAQGEPIPFSQEDIHLKGHAIELRLTAEDPFREMAPGAGKIDTFIVPIAPFLRHDCGYETGDEVPQAYDSLLSKLIVSGATREEAIRNAEWVVSHSSLSGLASLLPFYKWLLRYSSFRRGAVLTRFLDDEYDGQIVEAHLVERARDRLWRKGSECSEVVEIQRLVSDEAIGAVDVYIRHRRDGTFVVAPVVINNDGTLRLLGVEHRAASNSLEVAMQLVRKKLNSLNES